MIRNYCKSDITKELVWSGTLVLVQVISKILLRMVLRR